MRKPFLSETADAVSLSIPVRLTADWQAGLIAKPSVCYGVNKNSFCLPRRECEALSFGARMLFSFANFFRRDFIIFEVVLVLPHPTRTTERKSQIKYVVLK